MGTYSCSATKSKPQTLGANDREQLVVKTLQKVKLIAWRISNRLPVHVEVQELEGAGILGLLHAAQKFDPKHGVGFPTYAEHRIKGSILDSFRRSDWLPRSLRTMGRKLRAAQRQLEQRLARTASYEEVRAEMGISLGSFHKLLMQLRGSHLVSLETLGVHESPGRIEVPLGATPDPNTSSPHDILLKSETKNILARAIESLSPKQRLVVLLYYYDELTMREIGQILGVNESRVSQHHSAAMRNLRGKLSWTKIAA
jgi:RNA polymerase sigma factor for flagellar operon FliA